MRAILRRCGTRGGCPLQSLAHRLAHRARRGWRYGRAMRLLLKWLLSAVALLALTYLYGGVQVAGLGSALLAALVIGLLNVFVRPILVVLTLPVTLLTVGLFLFVINALMFWAASGLLSGFAVTGFGAALLGSLIYSLLGLVIEAALGGLFRK
jgi:putative membrane protein